MQFSRRKPPPYKLIAIGLGVAVVALVAAVFWYAHQAEQNPPVQRDIRIEAEYGAAPSP